jgi:hypothetical protein
MLELAGSNQASGMIDIFRVARNAELTWLEHCADGAALRVQSTIPL